MNTQSLRSQTNWLLLLGVAVVLAAAVIVRATPAAQSVAGAAGPTQPPTSVDGSTPGGTFSTALSGCRMLRIEEDRAAPAAMVALMSGVVRATIVDIDSAVRWATPDGSMPHMGATLETLNAAYRVAHVRVTAVRSGQESVGQVLAVRVPGGSFPGTISGGSDGCSTIVISGTAALDPGSDVVLLFGRVPALGPTPASTIDAVDAWPVVSGNVQQPDGSSVSIASFMAGADN